MLNKHPSFSINSQLIRLKSGKIYISFGSIVIFLVLLIPILDLILGRETLVVRLGTFNVSPMDWMTILLFFYGITSLFVNKIRIYKSSFPLILIGILLIIAYFRGLSQFGIETATNSFRSQLYFFIIIFSLIIISQENAIPFSVLRLWKLFALVLFIIALYRWGLVILGADSISEAWIAPGGLRTRVIDASNTLSLLQGAIFMLLIKQINKSMMHHLFALFLLIPAVILLQHRTVWVVIIAVALSAVFIRRRIKPILMGLIIGLAFISLIAILIIVEDPFMMSLIASAADFGTFAWRVEGWLQLVSLDRFQGPFDLFFGRPFGTGYDRLSTTSLGVIIIRTESPHNYYVKTFLDIGIFGVFLLVFFYFRTLFNLLKHKQNQIMFAFALIMISQLVFFVAYQPSPEQGLLFGAAHLLTHQRNEP